MCQQSVSAVPDIGHWIEYKQKHGKPEWSWSAVNIRDRDRPDLGFLGSSTQLLGVAPLQRWGWIMRLWDRAGQVWSCSSYRSKIYGHNPHPKPGLLLQMFLENKCSLSGFLFRFLPLPAVSGDACQSSWRYLSVPPRRLSVYPRGQATTCKFLKYSAQIWAGTQALPLLLCWT